MPFKSNAQVKSSIKGSDKLSDTQLSKFRSTFNGAFASCMKEHHDKSKCDGYAAATAWSVVKKSKNEDGSVIQLEAKLEQDVLDGIAEYLLAE